MHPTLYDSISVAHLALVVAVAGHGVQEQAHEGRQHLAQCAGRVVHHNLPDVERRLRIPRNMNQFASLVVKIIPSGVASWTTLLQLIASEERWSDEQSRVGSTSY